jgi:hypothetical protein
MHYTSSIFNSLRLAVSGQFKLQYVSYAWFFVTTPSQNDGVNQDHVDGFSVKRKFTSTCIQDIIIVF